MRILGLDYGDRTIGAALSDELFFTAQGLEIIRRSDENNLKASIVRLKEIIAKYSVGLIVLGYPKNMNNTEGPRCEKTLAFKKRLEKELKGSGVDIILQDERLSTAEASRVLLEGDVSRRKRGQVIDKMAAVIILQNYLDTRHQFAKNNENKNGGRETAGCENIRKSIKIKRNGAIIIDSKDQKGNLDENMKDGFPQEQNQDEDLDWDNNTVIITDEDGNETEFYILDEMTHNNNKYLLVVESDLLEDDEAEADILKEVGEDGEELVYEELDDEEFEIVAQLFNNRLDDYDIEF